MRSHRFGAILFALTTAACSGGGQPVTSDDDGNDAASSGAGASDPSSGPSTGATTGTGGDFTTGAGGDPTTTGSGGDPSTTGSGGDPGTTGSGGDPSTTGSGGMGGAPNGSTSASTSSSSTTSSSSSTTSGGMTAVCGDGMIDAPEQCDDGNTASNDGCSTACAQELGWSCNGEPSICTTICGDGVIVGNEGCDDANANPNDGCSSACQPENDYLCDGVPSVCNLVPAMAGHLVITEIMKDPGPSVTDSNGEWFEVHNPTSTAFDLMGVEIADQGSDSHVIASHLVVPAGGYAVLGRNANLSLNGGTNVDYVYSGVTLANGDDEIELYQGNTLIDAVAYTDAAFPDDEGTSMNLTSGANHVANDSGSNWCGATSAYGNASMLGTPGSNNVACSSGPPPPPPGWTCNASFYDASDGCDCGCGVTDPDCATTASSSCQWCDNSGSCSMVTGCGDISATNNAVCGPPPPPPSWTCNASFYGASDGCDCGCGATDPDCADSSAGSCQWCDNAGSCSTVTGCGDINPSDNASCGAPATWTCNPSFYNAADGCDCGCGEIDPDCADASVGSCDWCDDAGSCSVLPGCFDINPFFNASCF